MKLLLGTILTSALLIIGILIIKTYKETHKLARIVRKVLIVGLIVVLFNIISLYTRYEDVCLLAYCGYFIASAWMLYYLLQFSIEYIGHHFEYHINKVGMILLLIADSISVAINYFRPYQFTLNPVTLLNESYYELEVSIWFIVHYGIILMLVIFCLISLFYRSYTAPVFYRRKYLTIAVIMVILVILNVFTITSAIDVSVIGYVIEGIGIYYCVFVYTPQKLLSKTLYHVSQDMSVGVFVMDIEGNILYFNKYAKPLLSTENPLVNKKDITLEMWCRNQYLNRLENFTEEHTFYCKDTEIVLKIQLQRMMDVKSHLQGGYFVIQDRTEEINKLKKERYQAHHDPLTDLYNKSYFCEKARSYINRHMDEKLLMICTDIKDFKMINDFLGPKSGDTVLINFANMIREQIPQALIYGRLGNDIFAILMKKEDFDESFFIREEQDALLQGTEKNVSFPIISYTGVYEITERVLPIFVMCDRARMAMSTIKGDYHKRIAYYDDNLRASILHEQELISNLSTAIAEEQLQMYLQPQMDADGNLLGSEALIRWIHPEKGPIMPGDFIPVFEKNGLISDVDRYIWEKACALLKKWKDEGREDLYISVNISPRDFYFLNIFQIFTELVEKYDISPKNIKLEITETAIVMDFNRQMDLITRLRQTGFVVEMDDFGSGYSSLNMLKDIHVDILKIDMAFLKKANDEERSRKILKMVIALSKQLGMPVITEGIESAEQVQFLTEMGCEMFQGYYFAKPMDVATFEAQYLK